MDPKKIAEYARSLYAAHGDKAEAEAAQKMNAAEAAGNAKEAEDWRGIREAVRALRGSNES
jgi:hypothetical protein